MNPRTQLAVAAAGVTLLSSTALHATFVDSGWIAPVVGAVLSVLVGAELGSRAGQHLVARSVWRFVGSALAALFYLTAVWAHQGAFLGFIPRGHTWHLLRLLYDKAFTEVHDLPTPAPTYRALMLLTATGVAMVAIAVDQLSVRAPLIGLPLLALYSVPEWLARHGTGWVPLALGGSGYVGLLIREGRDRTSRWGRTVTGATTLGRNRSASAAMSQAGWRIGTAALAVALVVPPLIPDLGHFELAKGGGVSSATVVHYDTWTSLSGSLSQNQTINLYTYTSSDGSGRYLRTGQADTFCESCLHGLAGFNGPAPVADDGIDPTQDALVPGETPYTSQSEKVSTRVVIGPQLGQTLLPIPLGTTKLDNLSGAWLYQQRSSTVFSPDADATRNTSFTAASLASDPSEDALEASRLTKTDAASHASDLALPSDLPSIVSSTAKKVVKGTHTPYEEAIALQTWFTNGLHHFTYSLQAPTGPGFTPLVEFLTVQSQRHGFCQQYASAMAILARTLGIPARVGLGFTVGSQSGGTFTVNNHDAHAWPELYFHGLGWVRFEPTPRGDNQTDNPSYARVTVAQIQNLSKPDPNKSVAPGAGGPTTFRGPNPAGEGGNTGAKHHANGLSLPVTGNALTILIVVLVVIVIAIGLPLLQTTLRRRRRRHSSDPREIALVAWRECLRDAYDLGFFTSSADSPRQTARRLVDSAALSVTASEALGRLARAVERARYAPAPGDARGLLRDAEVAGAALFAAAPRGARLRARTIPPSMTAAAGERFSLWTTAVSRRLGRLTEKLVAAGNRAVRRRPA